MKKSIIEQVGAFIDRRSFLQRVALVTGSFVAGVLGLPDSAEASNCGPGAWHVNCCCLCKNPFVTCQYPYETWEQNCTATWNWTCVQQTPVWSVYNCIECFGTCTEITNPQPPPDECTEQYKCTAHCCNDVLCSHITQIA